MSRLSQRRQMYRRQLAESWLREHQPAVWRLLKQAADTMAIVHKDTVVAEVERGRNTQPGSRT